MSPAIRTAQIKMRRVRIALFLVLYRVIPSCHSWGFSPIAPSWGCSKGLKTKKWPELQLFAITDCRRAQRRKLRPGIAANQLWSSPLPLCRWGKGVRNRKKVAQKSEFLFLRNGSSQRSNSCERHVCLQCQSGRAAARNHSASTIQALMPSPLAKIPR